jgi:hypothetical protein
MKKLSLSIVVILLLLGTGNAFAQCHSVLGPYSSGPISWYVYSQDQSCYSTTDGISADTVSCYTGSGWKFDGAYLMNAHMSITLGSTDPIIDANNWTASSFIEFNTSNGSAYDWIELAAYVQHPNNTVSMYSLFFWDGTMGNLNGCAEKYGLFSANTGDTITIQINASDPHGATIRASVPRLINTR